jgi:hypothetical protein
MKQVQIPRKTRHGWLKIRVASEEKLADGSMKIGQIQIGFRYRKDLEVCVRLSKVSANSVCCPSRRHPYVRRQFAIEVLDGAGPGGGVTEAHIVSTNPTPGNSAAMAIYKEITRREAGCHMLARG